MTEGWACRHISFAGAPALHLPPSTHLTLACGGGSLDLGSRGGPPHLGANSTLTLRECHISGVQPDPGPLPSAADALVLWPALHSAAIVAVDSFLQEPCAVRFARCVLCCGRVCAWCMTTSAISMLCICPCGSGMHVAVTALKSPQPHLGV